MEVGVEMGGARPPRRWRVGFGLEARWDEGEGGRLAGVFLFLVWTRHFSTARVAFYKGSLRCIGDQITYLLWLELVAQHGGDGGGGVAAHVGCGGHYDR